MRWEGRSEKEGQERDGRGSVEVVWNVSVESDRSLQGVLVDAVTVVKSW